MITILMANEYFSPDEVASIVGSKIIDVKQDDSAIVELVLDNGYSINVNFYPECLSISLFEATPSAKTRRIHKSSRRR